LKRKVAFTDLTVIDNLACVSNKLDASIQPETVQSIDESNRINSSNESIKASLSIMNDSFKQKDLVRNPSSSSDPTHYKQTTKMNFQRNQTIDIC